ncbi:MAG: DMT family transporter, partial [Anaerolineales bacterium]|nr:DMT family transporter [Anaerolineales bacterium]
GAIRLVIGGTGLIAWAYWRGALRNSRPWPVVAVVTAAAAVAAYQPLFFSAVFETGVAVGTVVAIGSAPLFAGLLGAMLLKEKLDLRWGLATGLAILGCVLLFATGERSGINLVGITLALGAGLAYAVYATTGKIILRTHSADALGAAVFGLAAVFLLPLLGARDVSWAPNPRNLILLLHLGLITTTVAYILFARGLRLITVATAVTLSLAEPLTAATLGLFLLGEERTVTVLAGMLLLIGGLAILARRPAAVEEVPAPPDISGTR